LIICALPDLDILLFALTLNLFFFLLFLLISRFLLLFLFFLSRSLLLFGLTCLAAGYLCRLFFLLLLR
jgi:hypothetical protein